MENVESVSLEKGLKMTKNVESVLLMKESKLMVIVEPALLYRQSATKIQKHIFTIEMNFLSVCYKSMKIITPPSI